MTARRLAIAIAIVDLVGIICFALFAVAGGPFGTLNDVSSGAIGVLSGALAWPLYSTARAPMSGVGALAVPAAIIGAIAMVAGSVLVIFGVTGWFFAGLVSTAGGAFIGLWLLVLSLDARRSGQFPRGQNRLGIAAAVVMLLGLAAVIGIAIQTDDPQTAPWYVNAGLASWLGTFLLYPVWCLRLGILRRANALGT